MSGHCLHGFLSLSCFNFPIAHVPGSPQLEFTRIAELDTVFQNEVLSVPTSTGEAQWPVEEKTRGGGGGQGGKRWHRGQQTELSQGQWLDKVTSNSL